MRVVYGLYEAWLTPTFFLERGKAYDADEAHVAEAVSRFPDAFGNKFAGVTEEEDFEEPVRRGPGRPRNV